MLFEKEAWMQKKPGVDHRVHIWDIKFVRTSNFDRKRWNITKQSISSEREIIKANQFLNRNWSIEGKVIYGRKLGRTIGFPTCNINLRDYVIAKPGVYAVRVYIKNKKKYLRGIANLGYRPTFNQKKLLLEVNLFNFSGNLYNKNLRVEFLKFIRKELKFKNIDQLKKQIKLDLKIAKKFK